MPFAVLVRFPWTVVIAFQPGTDGLDHLAGSLSFDRQEAFEAQDVMVGDDLAQDMGEET